MKRDLFWNTAGSLIYALMSMILAFFVMRTQGAEDGGIFGFGFSTFGQQMFIVAYFGIRPFQITDVKREYSFGEYRRLRILSSAAALLIAAAWLFFLRISGAYSPYKALVIWLLAAYKAADGYADVYESEFQRDGKLYLAGKLLALRTLVCGGAFMLFLLLSHNLLYASLLAALLQLFMLGVYKLLSLRRLSGLMCHEVQGGRTGKLFRDTLLLFLSVFLDFYVFSAAKYAVDLQLSDADNGIFNLLFMPTNVIYLIANFAIKPFMTRLAAAYERREFSYFSGILKRLAALIAGLTALCCLGAFLLGGPVLRLGELVLGSGYAGMLVRHRAAFLTIIFGGGVYALANLFYYVLVIMRRQHAVFVIYLVLAVAAAALSPAFVRSLAVGGAALCYAVLMLGLCAGFFGVSRFYLRKEADGCKG